MGLAIDYQLHRVSVDIAKGFRQFQKADAALSKGNVDSAVVHLSKGLDLFGTAGDHAVKAEDDAYNKAGEAIDKGNKELNKCIDAYGNDKIDSAEDHYASAMDDYDKALDLIS